MENKINPNVLEKEFKNLNELVYENTVEDDQHASITPTTNKGRLTEKSKKDFIKNVKKELEKLKETSNNDKDFYTKVNGDFEDNACFVKFLENQEEELKELVSNKIFIQKYQYKECKLSEVIRFGINLKDDNIPEELSSFNKTLEDSLNWDVRSDKSGRSSESTNSNVCSGRSKITTFESLVLKTAIYFLEKSSNNIALVDVFERVLTQQKDKNSLRRGAIDINKLDSHTVVLYKTEDGKMLIIDPTNPTFSKHLSTFGDGKCIETLSEKTIYDKIYEPQGKDTDIGKDLVEKYSRVTGPNIEQYRDCIDIAVKIGFVLNNYGKKYKSIDEILKSSEIKLITNNPSIDKYSLKNSYPVKLKQASNIEIIEASNLRLDNFLEQFNKETQLLNSRRKQQVSELDGEYNSYREI